MRGLIQAVEGEARKLGKLMAAATSLFALCLVRFVSGPHFQ
jgi:hypothetical protein